MQFLWRGLAGMVVTVALHGCHCTGTSDAAPTREGSGGSGSLEGGTAEDWPACEPLAELAAMAPLKKGSGGYAAPSPKQLESLRELIVGLAARDPTRAAHDASSADYRLCGGGGLVLLRPRAAGHAWVVVRREAKRALVIGAPHGAYEPGTRDEAALLFDKLGARALVVSGTHRCANQAPSPCQGTTQVCSEEDAPFAESDMGHVTGSAFQAAHEALAGAFPQAIVVSLHGMVRDGISVSDGTTGSASASSLVARVAGALSARFAGVTSCNDYGAGNHQEHLCGTTNTQGRHLNGVVDACNGAPAAASGRFLHLEQSSAVRQQAQLVVEALAAALPPP